MRNAFAILLSFFFVNLLVGQQASLGFSPNGVRISTGAGSFAPDSVVAMVGEALSYELTVKNKGQTAYNGFVDLGIGPLDTLGFADTLFSTIAVNLNPGDSTMVIISDSFDTSAARYYNSGGGSVVVIVVWPAGRSGPTIPTDTVRIQIMIDPVSSVPGWIEGGLAVSVYPNPAFSEVLIDYGTIKKEVEYVILLDPNGKKMAHFRKPVTRIDLSEYPSGAYYLNIGGKQNQRAVFKLVKQ